MRLAMIFISGLLVFACQQRPYNDVWRQYDWLPPDAEYDNPYLLPREVRQGYPTPYPARPVYDNDYDYVPPRGWGVCTGSDNLGQCE